MKTILFILVSLFLAISPAHADEASHRQAAEEYLEISKAREAHIVTVNHLLAQAAPQYRDIYRKFYSKYVSWDDLKSSYVKLAVDNFSEQELKELTAFCKTTIGKKAVELKAILNLRAMDMFRDRLEPHSAELQADIVALEKNRQEQKQPQ